MHVQRRRAITLFGNAFYSTVTDLPKDEDDAISLILAAAMNIENACFTSQTEDYRIQVRIAFAFLVSLLLRGTDSPSLHYFRLEVF